AVRCTGRSGTHALWTTSNCTSRQRHSARRVSLWRRRRSRRRDYSSGRSPCWGRTCSSKDMFTGLIERVGKVAGLEPDGTAARLRVETDLAPELIPGESVAVNGVCLTVTRTVDGEMHADLGPETLRVTTLGTLT